MSTLKLSRRFFWLPRFRFAADPITVVVVSAAIRMGKVPVTRIKPNRAAHTETIPQPIGPSHGNISPWLSAPT